LRKRIRKHASDCSILSYPSIQVTIDHQADWWLGSPDSKYSIALAKSIEKEWGELPISIREGGSIPALPLLEKALSAQCVHLPMGKSITDLMRRCEKKSHPDVASFSAVLLPIQ